MIRIFRHYVPRSLVLLGTLELLLLALAGYGGTTAAWLRIGVVPFNASIPIAEFATFAVCVQVAMIALGMYHRDSINTLSNTAVRLGVSFVAGFMLLTVVVFAVPGVELWRSATAFSFTFAFVAIMVVRAVYLRYGGAELLKRRILVVGTGQPAARILELENGGPRRDFMCAGFVEAETAPAKIDRRHIVSGINSIAMYARERSIDEIVVALEERRGALPVNDLLACKMDGTRVTEFSAFWERETGRVDLAALNPSWLVFSDGFPGGTLQGAIKRLFDIAASLTLLVFSFPLLFLTAIAVKIDSRGPIFYRQERVGLNGRAFMLLKFRSMAVDAEKDGQPKWADVNDPRVTRVGNIIRKTRIDETPQLINVLKGDMSIIGPRPERPYFVEELRQAIPFYFERHRVKPGISGWAQLNYPYGASVDDAREKFQYDLYYLKNYSIFLDILVLMQTLRVVVWSEGAR